MKLLVDHPYYASENNYFSNEAREEYDTFSDWYAEYKDADIDMNLIFRWDVFEDEDTKVCRAQIVMIRQRKGIYAPQQINLFEKKDEKQAIPLLRKHWKRLRQIWAPISE